MSLILPSHRKSHLKIKKKNIIYFCERPNPRNSSIKVDFTSDSFCAMKSSGGVDIADVDSATMEIHIQKSELCCIDRSLAILLSWDCMNSVWISIVSSLGKWKTVELSFSLQLLLDISVASCVSQMNDPLVLK